MISAIIDYFQGLSQQGRIYYLTGAIAIVMLAIVLAAFSRYKKVKDEEKQEKEYYAYLDRKEIEMERIAKRIEAREAEEEERLACLHAAEAEEQDRKNRIEAEKQQRLDEKFAREEAKRQKREDKKSKRVKTDGNSTPASE